MGDIRDEMAQIVRESNPKVVLTRAEDYDRPMKDVGIDSLDVMSILLVVAERFGVEIPDEDVDQLSTLNAIIAYVEARRQA